MFPMFRDLPFSPRTFGNIPAIPNGFRGHQTGSGDTILNSSLRASIKSGGAGRQMPVNVERLRTLLIANGYAELNITGDHALAVQHLPPVHRDPFDRILIAQARVEGMSLLTKDKRMIDYGAPVIKA